MLQYYITASSATDSTQSPLSIADGLVNAAERLPLKSNQGFLTLIVASSLLHLAVAVALLAGATPDNAGGGAVELEQISVTIVSASDLGLAARSSVQQPDEVASLPAELTIDGDVAIAKPVTKSPELAEPEVPAPLIDRALLAAPPPFEKREEPKEVTNDREPPKTDTPDQTPTQNRSTAAFTAPPVLGGNSAGKAIASRGEVNRYARDVALVIGRNSPRGVGLRGKVLVELTLSQQDGALLSTTVVKSSGTAKLDQLALSAIAKGKYPPPPPGMTAKDLTFRVPFAFE